MLKVLGGLSSRRTRWRIWLRSVVLRPKFEMEFVKTVSDYAWLWHKKQANSISGLHLS